jgi:two-component system chemotaxis response regulator CheY
VVEVDPGTCETCSRVLSHLGIVADIVNNGVAAVSMARRTLPDVVMVALQLRDTPGLEVVQWLRSNPALRSIPVIVLSTDARDVSRSKTWGVDAVLLKPASPDTMLNAIRDLVRSNPVRTGAHSTRRPRRASQANGGVH